MICGTVYQVAWHAKFRRVKALWKPFSSYKLKWKWGERLTDLQLYIDLQLLDIENYILIKLSLNKSSMPIVHSINCNFASDLCPIKCSLSNLN